VLECAPRTPLGASLRARRAFPSVVHSIHERARVEVQSPVPGDERDPERERVRVRRVLDHLDVGVVRVARVEDLAQRRDLQVQELTVSTLGIARRTDVGAYVLDEDGVGPEATRSLLVGFGLARHLHALPFFIRSYWGARRGSGNAKGRRDGRPVRHRPRAGVRGVVFARSDRLGLVCDPHRVKVEYVRRWPQ